MGKQAVATVIEVREDQNEKEQGKSGHHSIRSVFRPRWKSSKQNTNSLAKCHGPSLLHNLLPVIEPLLVVKPNLVVIENRILRRKQEPASNVSFQVPSGMEELNAWVNDASPLCDCDECSPKLYLVNHKNPHGEIRTPTRSLQSRKTRFSHGNTCHDLDIQQPVVNLRNYGHYEAMHLVRHHVSWLDTTYLQKEPHETASPATQHLKSLLQTWTPHLSAPSLQQSTSPAQLQTLFNLLNDIFFFNAIPSHSFPFSTCFSFLPTTRKNCFASTTYNPLIGGTHILLHPTAYRHAGKPEDLDIRWRNRLGTLLHEMCHAFLKAYVCRSCPMSEVSVGQRGHGRAWQVLARKVEEVVQRLVGESVDMGRWQALLHDFQGHGRVPSRHDLEVYGFVREGGCCRGVN